MIRIVFTFILKRFCFLWGRNKKQKRTGLQGFDTVARARGGSIVTGLVLALTLGAGSTLAEERHKREIYGRGKIFQNVAAEHVVPLLRNQARVTHWENGEGMRPDGGYVRIVWYGADGAEHACLQDREKGRTGGWGSGTYSGFTKHLKFRALRYPLKKAVYSNGDWYQLLRYDGQTGDLTTFLASKGRWWEADVGHLQARIPAVTWDICPGFPSAKSLGTTVNKKQTSRFYFELLRQDPGKRRLHPEFVNEEAHEWLTKE